MGERKRTSGWYYLLVLLVPIVGCGASFATGFTVLHGKVEEMSRVVMPGEAAVELKAGEYTGYYERQSVVDGTTYSTGDLGGLRCDLRDEAGAEVAVRGTTTRASYGFGAFSGESIFQFTAATPGRYRLACVRADGGDEPKVVLAVGGALMGSILVTMLPGLGGVILGIVFFVVVYRKRRRA